MRSTIRAALMLLPLSAALLGCSQVVPLESADDAADRACAGVIVRLPDTVAELQSRETDAQGTGAWGTPASVILRCGVVPPGPTADSPCVTVGGIDWLRDDRGDPNFLFTTYGRTPAIEVLIDSDGDPDVADDGVSGGPVLADLADAVGVIPATGACTALN